MSILMQRAYIVHAPRLLCFSHKLIRSFASHQWKFPAGHKTGIWIYNTASKCKVPLETRSPDFLSWYICGPTVYDSAHIGHAMCYVKLDIVRRILENVFGLLVVQVMGITDIDDKIITRANKLNISYKDVAIKYEEEFFTDMRRLGIQLPHVCPRVTDYIPHIIEYITRIKENGFAYYCEGNVFFDTTAYGLYGKFVPQDSEVTPDYSHSPKKSPRDFALWKVSKSGEPSWQSPWGQGRPGWHIECSAMACRIFGEHLDLHSGGIDLVFPHHENEEAQCCAYYAKQQWCNYWLHTGHLILRGLKMSKSLQNIVTVTDLLNQYSANTFRMFCLLSHYRSQVDYIESSLEAAAVDLKKITSFLSDCSSYVGGQMPDSVVDGPLMLQKLSETKRRVNQALTDDFSTYKAVDAIRELISVGNRELQNRHKVSCDKSLDSVIVVASYIHGIMEALGLELPKLHSLTSWSDVSTNRLTSVMSDLLLFRQRVRDFSLLTSDPQIISSEELKEKRLERLPLLQACDDLRSDLYNSGIRIKDTKGSSLWSVREGFQGSNRKES